MEAKATPTNLPPQMFALPTSGAKSTIQYQICKKLFWTKDGKTESAYVPASIDEMKSVAGKTNTFTAININTGNKVSVSIPTQSVHKSPFWGQQTLTKPTNSVPQVKQYNPTRTQVTTINAVSSPKVSNPTTIDPPKPQTTVTPPKSQISQPLSLTISSQMANQYAKMIDPSKFHILKVGDGKFASLTPAVTGQLTQNRIATSAQVLAGGPTTTTVTSSTTSIAKPPQTVILNGPPTTNGVPVTSIKTSGSKPIVFTITPTIMTTANANKPAVCTVGVANTPTVQSSTTANQPVQFMVNPSNLPQNITITLPTSSLIKSGASNTSSKVMIPIQSIMAAQNANNTAKISAVPPVQRTVTVTNDQQTHLKMLTPPTTPDPNLKLSTAQNSTIKTIAVGVPKQTIVTASSVIDVSKKLSTNVVQVQPVPIAITAVQSSVSDQNVSQSSTQSSTAVTPMTTDDTEKPNSCGKAETANISNVSTEQEKEKQSLPQVKAVEEKPMFQIGSVYTLSDNSAKELFPETNKVTDTIKVKTEPVSIFSEEETNVNTAFTQPEPKIDAVVVKQEPEVGLVRIKAEPPDTGYDKAMIGISTNTVNEKTTPVSTDASILRITPEFVDSNQTIKTEPVVFSTSLTPVVSTSPVLDTSLKPVDTSSKVVSSSLGQVITSSNVVGNANQNKKYVIVNDPATPVIPPTSNPITIQTVKPPDCMVLTPASNASKPGEPMKWTVVSPPAPTVSTTTVTGPSVPAEKTIVVHPPGTAMKATKSGMSTYIVKNPTGKTTLLQIKSAAATLSEMANVISCDQTKIQSSIIISRPPKTVVQVKKPTIPQTVQSTQVKIEKNSTEPTNLPNMTPIVQVEKMKFKLHSTTSNTCTDNVTTTSTTTSKITSETVTSTSASGQSPKINPDTLHNADTVTSKGKHTHTSQNITTKMMTRKRKQDLAASVKDDGDEVASSSKAEGKVESVQDERIRKLKQLLKEREAALEAVRKKIKVQPASDCDDD